jgi:hypothetical protein
MDIGILPGSIKEKHVAVSSLNYLLNIFSREEKDHHDINNVAITYLDFHRNDILDYYGIEDHGDNMAHSIALAEMTRERDDYKTKLEIKFLMNGVIY